MSSSKDNGAFYIIYDAAMKAITAMKPQQTTLDHSKEGLTDLRQLLKDRSWLMSNLSSYSGSKDVQDAFLHLSQEFHSYARDLVPWCLAVEILRSAREDGDCEVEPWIEGLKYAQAIDVFNEEL
ncbi:MAG: hypothetical protein Q9166_005361 [cf. Caloplaca sp. 2 TL-2023]